MEFVQACTWTTAAGPEPECVHGGGDMEEPPSLKVFVKNLSRNGVKLQVFSSLFCHECPSLLRGLKHTLPASNPAPSEPGLQGKGSSRGRNQPPWRRAGAGGVFAGVAWGLIRWEWGVLEVVHVCESEGWEADCERQSLRIVMRGHNGGVGVCVPAACCGSEGSDDAGSPQPNTFEYKWLTTHWK